MTAIDHARFEIGARVKERREAIGLSQEDLAFELGYSDKTAVSKIERGVNDIPRKKVLEFARVLHTTPEYLMGWTDDSMNYDEVADDIPDEIMDFFNGDAEQAYKAWQARNTPADETRDRVKEKYNGLFELLDKATPEQLDQVERVVKALIPEDES